MSPQKTVVIIDDHPLFREGLKSILQRSPAYKVIGEAGNAREGLQRVGELRPDVVTVDISLPDMNGIRLTEALAARSPKTRVLIVSMHCKIDHLAAAFQAGAKGYITKEAAAERLLEGLDTVCRGDYFVDSSVSRQVVKRLVEFPEREAKIMDAAYRNLTRREQEILRLLAEGLTSREIAEQLAISPKTVENHRTNIMSKLGLHSTLELVRYAARLGLIDLDLWKE